MAASKITDLYDIFLQVNIHNKDEWFWSHKALNCDFNYTPRIGPFTTKGKAMLAALIYHQDTTNELLIAL